MYNNMITKLEGTLVIPIFFYYSFIICIMYINTLFVHNEYII